MIKKILFLGFTVSILIFSNNLFAEINSIVPLKKPVLSKEEIQKKISINILKPLKKPTKTKEIKIEEEIVKKELVLKEKKLSFKIPKKKPTVAGISSAMNIKISKYYSKRDFGLAKKAISEMQKSKWLSALKIAKKAKDNSIYNFIQWRHLLTSGNQASFYEYQVFLNKNSDYPRIDRIRYLAEHKLSTESVSPKKIINWFGEKDPLSGYGKMILGESHILVGNKNKGTTLIKEGWITADLSKNEFKYFSKRDFWLAKKAI